MATKKLAKVQDIPGMRIYEGTLVSYDVDGK